MIDQEAYEAAVNEWFKELKDIITNDLLRQHINKYPVKADYEIKEQDEDSSNSSSEERK